jgi:hypothetical protein
MSPILIMAASDAAFDGRTFSALGRHERRRYIERSIASLRALHQAGANFDAEIIAELVRCRFSDHIEELIDER